MSVEKKFYQPIQIYSEKSESIQILNKSANKELYIQGAKLDQDDLVGWIIGRSSKTYNEIEVTNLVNNNKIIFKEDGEININATNNKAVIINSLLSATTTAPINENSGIIATTGWVNKNTRYKSDFSDFQTLPNDIGGFDSGTQIGTLTGKTLSEMWDELLVPTVYASITTNKTVHITGYFGDKEVGTVYTNIAITANYDKGTITDGDGVTTNNIGGNATNYVFTLLDSSTSASTNNTIYVSGVVEYGTSKFSVDIAHNSGISSCYIDNKGHQYVDTNIDNQLSETTESGNSSNIRGRFFILCGVFTNSADTILDGSGYLDYTKFSSGVSWSGHEFGDNGYSKQLSINGKLKFVIAYPVSSATTLGDWSYHSTLTALDFTGGLNDSILNQVVSTIEDYKLPNNTIIQYHVHTYIQAVLGGTNDEIKVIV